MPRIGKEMRKDSGRLGMSLKCEFCSEEEKAGGTTFDISRGGMCLFSDKEVPVGRTIEVQCKDLWDVPRQATVMWCQRVQHRLYRIGVSFGK